MLEIHDDKTNLIYYHNDLSNIIKLEYNSIFKINDYIYKFSNFSYDDYKIYKNTKFILYAKKINKYYKFQVIDVINITNDLYEILAITLDDLNNNDFLIIKNTSVNFIILDTNLEIGDKMHNYDFDLKIKNKTIINNEIRFECYLSFNFIIKDINFSILSIKIDDENFITNISTYNNNNFIYSLNKNEKYKINGILLIDKINYIQKELTSIFY